MKYCRGNYTREDLEQMKELIERDEHATQLSDIMQMQWSLTDNVDVGDKKRFDRVLQQVHRSIDLEERRASAFRKLLVGFSKIAAIMVIPICIALFVWIQHNQSKSNLEAQNTVEALRGEVKQIVLPDGTKVWLNSGSKLIYRTDFNKNIRKVSLEGEAYLEVTKNKQCPFVVQGRELSVKVLGTKFNVRSYKEDARVDVTLMEGSVRLTDSNEHPTDLCLLKPNQQAMLQKQSGKVLIRKVDAQCANEWIRGTLLFDDEDLDQIAHSLERQYNVSISFQSETIRHLKFYGKFKKAQSLDEILKIIVSRQNFHYSRRGDKIFFASNQ